MHSVLEAKLNFSFLQEVTMGVKGVFSVMQVIVKAGVNMRAPPGQELALLESAEIEGVLALVWSKTFSSTDVPEDTSIVGE